MMDSMAAATDGDASCEDGPRMRLQDAAILIQAGSVI